jgi:hypothetical protein
VSVAVSSRLVSAEVMKIRTTRAWWLFVGGFVILSVLAVLIGWGSNHNQLYPTLSDYPKSQWPALMAQAASHRTQAAAAAMAASMMTAGQFILLLITVLLGVHVATAEFTAHTLTATFLVEPRRWRVIVAKLVTAAAFGLAFWAFTSVLDGVVTPFFLSAVHLPPSAISASSVVRALVTGLFAYVLWALFGLGLGAVLRNQVIAAVTAIAAYAGGFFVVEAIVHLLYDGFHAAWLLSLAVLAPAEASNVMITAGRAFPHAPPWWVGALVLAGYGVALTVVGAVSLRRSDVR